MLKETERERGKGWRMGWRMEGGLYHPVTLCSPGHTAPGLLYPPPAINHLILSLLNRQPAPHILIKPGEERREREERRKQNCD